MPITLSSCTGSLVSRTRAPTLRCSRSHSAVSAAEFESTLLVASKCDRSAASMTAWGHLVIATRTALAPEPGPSPRPISSLKAPAWPENGIDSAFS